MRNLDLIEQETTKIVKKLITLKPPNSEGLILNVHQKSNKHKARFIYSDFQYNGNVLALANNYRQIYLIDFPAAKSWALKKFDSCTCIKFSESNEGLILIGKANGIVEVINIDSGALVAKLIGHEHSVISISFSQNNTCISASRHEAIVWDLSSYSKIQVLSLEKDCKLKFVHFVPISSHIVVCYQDDVIEVWQNGTFKTLKQFHSSNWKNHLVRSISFSRNGNIMVVSGYLPVLAIFQLNIWKLLKIINMPEYVNTIKKIQFIPQNFDGGCNRILAILSGNGVLYFYNIEDNVLISELKAKCEIINFSTSLTNVAYLSCTLCNGDVEIYDINFWLLKNECTLVEKAQDVNSKPPQRLKLKNYSRKLSWDIKKQMEVVLELDKLKAIIKEYQEFPEAYRSTIWEKVLRLPNNCQQYNSIVTHTTIAAFSNLYKMFPLEDSVTIRCLKHLLSNIVTWCPFFAQVDYLPCLLFPFVKVFHKKPVACFELCCTIIINWCQHWFEYHPLPPVNVLAIIDNVLMEHDGALLQHFSSCGVKPVIYSWSLLETAFSEVLTATEWLKFWDHVFVNEPSFLLCAVVAYNVVQRKYLMALNDEEEFYNFFHSQRPVDLKKLISKAYSIFYNTSERNHPRQYLNMFTSLSTDRYPVFEEYPANVVQFQAEHVNYIEDQLEEVSKLKKNMLKEKIKLNSYSDIQIKNEEERRMIEVEKACIQKIKDYQEVLKGQQDDLKNLRTELLDHEKKIIGKSQRNLDRLKTSANAGAMKALMDGLEMSENFNQAELKKLQENYEQEHLELLRKEHNLEELLRDEGPSTELANELLQAHKKMSKFKGCLKKTKHDLQSPRKTNVALTLATLDGLIRKIQGELEKNHTNNKDCNTAKENLKVHQLEKETNSLKKEIVELLTFLADNREDKKCPSKSCSEKSSCRSKGTTINQ